VAYERARVTALMAAARTRLDRIDGALSRLGAGTYGVCASCGVTIPADRLAALPTATTCVGCSAARL
jgi:RNA polymerase-binding transcription factor DksA